MKITFMEDGKHEIQVDKISKLGKQWKLDIFVSTQITVNDKLSENLVTCGTNRDRFRKRDSKSLLKKGEAFCVHFF